MPKVGLFIPCYVDQVFPRVGLATVDVLERLGIEVEFPPAQTCCGQPMNNTGCTSEARSLAQHYLKVFGGYEHVVCPSGSCVAMVRHHYEDLLHGEPGLEKLRHGTFELCEYLFDVLGNPKIDVKFPHQVGLHQSCHGLRELRLGSSSELVGLAFSKTRSVLGQLEGISFSNLTRADECCGFGGTFAVAEEAVSCMMGQDRLHDHEQAGTEVLAGNDISCLMHLEGLLRRDKKRLPVMHVAEILAGYKPSEKAN